jgi:hypothetical protein
VEEKAMKIAVFYPNTPNAVWSLSKGICTTLISMRHEVEDCPTTLDKQDAIIVSGPEYLWRSLRLQFPQWDKLPAHKYGWLHETVSREDYDNNSIATKGKLPVQDLKSFLDTICTPAQQDSEYGFKYLPFGVDTDVFTPSPIKDNNVLFIGSLYEKRRKLIEKYPAISIRKLKDFLTYRCDVTSSEYIRLTASASVVLNLPTLSQLNSTRVYEAMACKALLITPLMGGSDENYSMFETGKHLMYYTDSPMEALSLMEIVHTDSNVWHYSLNNEGQAIADAGYQEILKNHTLKQRLVKMLQIGEQNEHNSKTFYHDISRRTISRCH